MTRAFHWKLKKMEIVLLRITDEDFIVVNHEMGHIQYQRSYRNQSFLFRDGANPGFHEGIADILSLAVGNHQICAQVNLAVPKYI